MARTNTNSGGGGGAVTQIIAGTNVTISPIGGTGAVTINATGSGNVSGTGATNQVTYWTGANTIAGDNNFLWVPGTKAFSVGDLTSTGNDSRWLLDDVNLRSDFYSQNFYFRGYNADVVIFGEATAGAVSAIIGDVSTNHGGTRLSVVSDTIIDNITGYTDRTFTIKNTGGTGDYLLVDIANDDYALGDLTGIGNRNLLWINDTTNEVSARTPGLFEVTSPTNVKWLTASVTGGFVSIGDHTGAANGTFLKVDDTNQFITIETDGTIVMQTTASDIGFAADTVNGTFGMGDVQQNNTGVRFIMNTALLTLDFSNPLGVSRIGDMDSLGNDTVLNVNDATNRIFIENATFGLFGYTVGTLPAGSIGDTAYVTDALAPTYGAVAVGGGTVVTTVFFTGAAWITV